MQAAVHTRSTHMQQKVGSSSDRSVARPAATPQRRPPADLSPAHTIQLPTQFSCPHHSAAPLWLPSPDKQPCQSVLIHPETTWRAKSRCAESAQTSTPQPHCQHAGSQRQKERPKERQAKNKAETDKQKLSEEAVQPERETAIEAVVIVTGTVSHWHWHCQHALCRISAVSQYQHCQISTINSQPKCGRKWSLRHDTPPAGTWADC